MKKKAKPTAINVLLMAIMMLIQASVFCQSETRYSKAVVDLFGIPTIEARLQLIDALQQHATLSCQMGSLPGELIVSSKNSTEGKTFVQTELDRLQTKLLSDMNGMSKQEKGDFYQECKAHVGEKMFSFAIADQFIRGYVCDESDPFCTSDVITYPAGVNSGFGEEGPYYDCLDQGEIKNPAWFHLKIMTSGNIQITISSNPPKDIDFACWGPFSDPLEPCPNGLTQNKVVDCSWAAGIGVEYCDISNSLPGEYYILLITNWSNQPCDITFQKTEGTGETDCSIVPPPVGSNSPVCVGETLELYADNVPNATYQWTGPNSYSSTQQNPVIPNVNMNNAGIYTLVITVSGTSSDPVSIEVEVNPMPFPDFTFNEVCHGEPTVFTDASTVNPSTGQITQWEWAFGDGAMASGQNQQHTYSDAGIYQVTLTTYTGVGQCAQSITKQVLVKMSADVNAGTDVSIPNGWYTNLSGSASGGSGNYSFHWEPQSLVVNPGSAQTATISLSSTTLFTLTVTDNSGGCTTSDEVLVTITGSVFNVDASADETTICPGESTHLHANASGGSGNYTYSWSSVPAGFTSDQPNPVVTPVQTTTYSVTVFDGQNSLISQVTVELGALSIANAGPDKDIPSGWPTLLEGSVSGGSGAFTVDWQPQSWLENHTVIQPTTLPLSTTTMFTLTLSDNASGCESVDQVLVTISGGILGVTASATPDEICSGQNSQLFAIGSGGSGSYTYLWTTVPSSTWTSTQQNPIVTPTLTTIYQVEINDGQNNATDQVTVEVGLITIANAGPDINIPIGTDTQLLGSVSGGSGSYGVEWEPAAFLVNANVLQPLTILLENTQVFQMQVTDNSSGCVSTDNMTVIVAGLVLATNPTATPAMVCPGESSQLLANASGGSGIYNYSWSSDPVGFSSDSPNPVVYPELSTIYFVLIDDGINQVQGQVNVAVGAYSEANAGDDLYTNFGWPVTLQGSVDGNQDYSVNWFPSALLEDATIITPQTLPLEQSTQFSLTVTNNSSQCVSTDDVHVSVTGGPLGVDVSSSAYVICSGSAVQLMATPFGGSGNYSYQWTSSTGFSSTLQSPTVEPSISTTYSVIVSDGLNTSSGQTTITVNPSPQANAGSNQVINVGTWTMLEGSASGGTGNFVYNWAPSDSLNNPALDQFLPQPKTKLLMNSTQFTLVVNDLNGCISNPSTTWVITGGDQLGLLIEAEYDTLCQGQQTYLMATAYGGSGEFSYQWKANNSSWQSSEQNPLVSPEVTTIFTSTVNDGYMEVSSSKLVCVHALPEVNILPIGFVAVDNTIFVCVRDSVWLDAGPDLEYLWMNGATSQKQKALTNGNWIDIQEWSVRVINSQTGCQNTDNLTLFFDFNTCNIGVDEHNIATNIMVYPNPSNSTFIISFKDMKEKLRLSLFSQQGALIFEMKDVEIDLGQELVKLDFANFCKGIYLLQIQGDRFVVTKKLIKR